MTHTGVDFQDRTGALLYKIAQCYSPPAYVKAASEGELLGEATLPDNAFADQTGRTLPMHTRAATWRSVALFFDKQAELAPAVMTTLGKRLTAAVDFWGLRGDVKELATKVAAQRTAHDLDLKDSDFAVVETFDDGRTERHLRLLNPTEVKTAAAWFDRYRFDFDWHDRQKIAHKILTKAEEFQSTHRHTEGGTVDFDPATRNMLTKTAGQGCAAASSIVSLLRQRAVLGATKNLKMAQQLSAVADALTTLPPEQVREKTAEVAAVVDEYDRNNNLIREYGDGLAPPEDVIFGLTHEKVADYAARHLVAPDGTVYSRAIFDAGLPLTTIREAVGDDFAEHVADSFGFSVDGEKVAAALDQANPIEVAAFTRLLKRAMTGLRFPQAVAPTRTPIETFAAALA